MFDVNPFSKIGLITYMQVMQISGVNKLPPPHLSLKRSNCSRVDWTQLPQRFIQVTLPTRPLAVDEDTDPSLQVLRRPE